MIRIVLTVLAALGLGSCASVHVMSHVPLSTIGRLLSFDFRKLDTDAFRVAARLPDVLEPREVKSVINVSRGDARRKLELILVRAEEDAELAALRPYEKSGQKLFVYRASQEDAARVAKLREELSASSEAVSAQPRGQISVAVKACRHAALAKRALPTTTLLRTDQSGYFVLIDELDLNSIIDAAQFASEVPPCK